ncbi:MAG: hypothetical protein NC395_06970 [Prevotella sp.]|nr:hypothetical protein [Prevotella sp.]
MQENPTSCETLQDKALPVRADTQPENTAPRKTASFGDTLTLQAILCVLMALGFVILNMVNGGLAAEIFELYKGGFGGDSTVAEVFAAAAEFLGTAPIDHV